MQAWTECHKLAFGSKAYGSSALGEVCALQSAIMMTLVILVSSIICFFFNATVSHFLGALQLKNKNQKCIYYIILYKLCPI